MISFLVDNFLNSVSFFVIDVKSFFEFAIKNLVNLILIINIILLSAVFCYNFSLISGISIILNCTQKRNIIGFFDFQFADYFYCIL